MKDIIPPIDREVLLAELTPDKFVRKTNNAGREIYIFTHHDSPNLMREVGRLREISFREAGGGTDEEVDIDEFDIHDNPYKQLIVWDPEHQSIVGGYRFIEGPALEYTDGQPYCAVGELFRFSDEFMRDYLPYTIELGRSFVQPFFQPSVDVRRGLYSLDNLWDGLGALTVDYPRMKYFFGKITMYPSFHVTARDLIHFLLEKYFKDPYDLVLPREAVQFQTSREEMAGILSGQSYEEDYKILIQQVRSFGENIPPLVNAYTNLSPTMKVFGTAINESFGQVEETGILVTIPDIYEAKKARHIADYQPRKNP